MNTSEKPSGIYNYLVSNATWLWRTIACGIFGIVLGAVVFLNTEGQIWSIIFFASTSLTGVSYGILLGEKARKRLKRSS